MRKYLENLIKCKDKKLNSIKEFYKQSTKYLNYKIGVGSGLISGGIVSHINSEYGILSASGACGKQFLYNVFFTGINLKTCKKISEKIKSTPTSLVCSTIIPTAQAFAITYGIHKYGGTPEAFDSSIWQVYVNAPIFFGFGLYYRGKSKKSNQ
jgi:hypothetical protein